MPQTENNREEIFKDIPDFDGKYQISNWGSVVSHVTEYRTPHFKKRQTRKGRGNKLYVSLHKRPGESSKKRLVSALVLETFGFPRPNKIYQPKHRNGNLHNCKLENLYWGRQKMPWEN